MLGSRDARRNYDSVRELRTSQHVYNMKGSAFLLLARCAVSALVDKGGTWDVAQGFRDEHVKFLDWEKSVVFELDDFEMDSETQATALISQDVIDHFRDEGIELYSVARARQG